MVETLVDPWKRNHMLYMSPYPEGLVHNPGSSTQELVMQVLLYPIGGNSRYRWLFVPLLMLEPIGISDGQINSSTGNQDSPQVWKARLHALLSQRHRVMHMDTTEGQYRKYPRLF